MAEEKALAANLNAIGEASMCWCEYVCTYIVWCEYVYALWCECVCVHSHCVMCRDVWDDGVSGLAFDDSFFSVKNLFYDFYLKFNKRLHLEIEPGRSFDIK